MAFFFRSLGFKNFPHLNRIHSFINSGEKYLTVLFKNLRAILLYYYSLIKTKF